MPPDPYPIIDADEWREAADEFVGVDEKVWLEEPGPLDRWLFKPVTVKDGRVQGEDWGEKIASELAGLLGLPCARIQMARRGGLHGSLSRNLKPPEYDMHNGAVVLSDLIPDYVPGALATKGRPGHSLTNIAKALEGAGQPPGSKLPVAFTGFDVFVGMLVLDAWVANRDRHDENWSVLRPFDLDQSTLLCGAYDQAGCLGFNLQDSQREERIKQGTVRAWAEKGTAYRFEHLAKPVTLVDHALAGLDMASSLAREHWLCWLSMISDQQVAEVLDRTPRLSVVARTFAAEVLKINKGRLLS